MEWATKKAIQIFFFFINISLLQGKSNHDEPDTRLKHRQLLEIA